MLSAFTWGLAAVTVLFALGVVAFESAKRQATCLLLTCGGGGVLVLSQGAPETGAALFWLGSSSAMLIFLCGLLLNQSAEDIGRRRLSVRRTVACLLVAYFGAATAGMFFAPNIPSGADVPAPVPLLADALFGGGAINLVLIALSLLALVPAALLLVRKQA